ncbi:uncharacterized protein JCM15063_002072 [Sporobolomyces koalae]|uniref:uncharacterized protein n=1 Tax=Sporobolomyces koalae TaxID=500713 RepID=UPI00316B7B14
MAFSPRARPRTANLSFTDPDLTDNYRDLSLTSSVSGDARTRHARGDTPLSRPPSVPSSYATSTSTFAGAATSNLERLLDFLDDDDHARAGASTPPPPAAPPSAARSALPPRLSSARSRPSQSPHTDLPDSPSPRPGSVAAMRSGERSMLSFQPSAPEPQEGSVDSIARIAQAALDEFDDTISADPTSTQTTPRTEPIAHTSASPYDRSVRSETRRDDGVEPSAAIPSEPLPQSPQSGSRHDFSGKGDPHYLNLIRELREAQDYIGFLQAELRTIGQVVTKLKEHHDDPAETVQVPLASAPEGQNRPQAESDPALPATIGQCPALALPVPSTGARSPDDLTGFLNGSNSAAFQIVKHLISILPSTLPSSPSSVSVDSIARSLEFVRTADALSFRQGQGPDGDRPVRRRDDEIFTDENFTRLEEVIRGTSI